ETHLPRDAPLEAVDRVQAGHLDHRRILEMERAMAIRDGQPRLEEFDLRARRKASGRIGEIVEREPSFEDRQGAVFARSPAADAEPERSVALLGAAERRRSDGQRGAGNAN